MNSLATYTNIAWKQKASTLSGFNATAISNSLVIASNHNDQWYARKIILIAQFCHTHYQGDQLLVVEASFHTRSLFET